MHHLEVFCTNNMKFAGVKVEKCGQDGKFYNQLKMISKMTLIEHRQNGTPSPGRETVSPEFEYILLANKTYEES